LRNFEDTVRRRLTACFVLAACLFLADAGATPPGAAGKAQELLAGVILDQTVTVAGHEFYKQFCMFWHDKPVNELFSLAVRERLSAQRGNQVVVEYMGRVVFHGALPASRADLRPVSLEAVDVAYETVANAEVQRLLFTQDELAPDEF
jgi:curli production assembly/transport component CsgE